MYLIDPALNWCKKHTWLCISFGLVSFYGLLSLLPSSTSDSNSVSAGLQNSSGIIQPIPSIEQLPIATPTVAVLPSVAPTIPPTSTRIEYPPRIAPGLTPTPTLVDALKVTPPIVTATPKPSDINH